MRIEDFERRENEDNKEYFTRVAAMLRELKDAGNDDDGMCDLGGRPFGD